MQICGIHIFGCLYRILKDEGLSEQSSGERWGGKTAQTGQDEPFHGKQEDQGFSEHSKRTARQKRLKRLKRVNYQTSAVLRFLLCNSWSSPLPALWWQPVISCLLSIVLISVIACALIFPPKASQSGVQEAELFKLMSDIAEVVHRVHLGAPPPSPTAIKRFWEMFLLCCTNVQVQSIAVADYHADCSASLCKIRPDSTGELIFGQWCRFTQADKTWNQFQTFTNFFI